MTPSLPSRRAAPTPSRDVEQVRRRLDDALALERELDQAVLDHAFVGDDLGELLGGGEQPAVGHRRRDPELLGRGRDRLGYRVAQRRRCGLGRRLAVGRRRPARR